MKKDNLPELRFSTFGGDWNQHKLGDLCDEFRSGKSIKAKDIQNEGRYPVLGGNGLRGYTNTYNHDGVYTLIGRQGALCGNTNISYGKAYFTEHAIAVKGNENNDTRFLFYLLGEMNLGQYSGQSAQPGLAVNKLIELTTFTPNHAEQTKIGDFFKQLDNTISLHQQELDTLKQTKQGFLQKMFPKEGESVPEIRFSGFNSSWGMKEFANIVNRVSKQSNADNVPKIEFEDIVSGEGRLKRDVIEKFDNRKGIMFEPNFILYGKLRPYLKNWLLPDFKGVALGDFWVFESNNSCPTFIYYLIQTDKYQVVANLSSGTKMPRSDWKTVSSTNFYIPSIEEQEKIGSFFKQLDELIALQQQELDALKQTKKAFLQKMFV